ncbi:MAG: hypothetical protein ABR604_07810 [Jatrophihabitantaceae bacterium]
MGDSDVLWGTRTGLDMLSSGRLPHTATHSWTAAGRSWIPNSWGWDLLLAGIYRLGGLVAIGVLDVLLILALALLVARAAARAGAHVGWTAFVFLLVGYFIMEPLEPRPQFVAYLMIFTLPPLLSSVLSGDRRRAAGATAAICGLQVLWINLHSSAVLGPVILGAGGLGLLLGRDGPGRDVPRPAARLLAVVSLAAGCCLITPYGTAPLTNINQVRRASAGLINEWAPAGIHGTGPIFALVAVAVGIVAACLAFRARRFDTVAITAVLGVATASAVRFSPLLLLYAVPEFAVAAGRIPARPAFIKRVIAAGCVVLAMFVVPRARSFARLSVGNASPGLVAALAHDCRLVNDYSVGGAVMLARPDVAVSVDGRNDMYGRTLLLSVEGILANPPGTIAQLDAAGVSCALGPISAPLFAALSREPHWHVVGKDGHRVLLLRSPALAPGG